MYALGNHDPFAKASVIARGHRRGPRRRPVRRVAGAPARVRPAQRQVSRRRPRLDPGVRRPGGRGGRADRSPQGLDRPTRSRSPRRPRPRPVRPSPSVVVADTDTGAPTAVGQRGLGLGPPRPESGPVADHLDDTLPTSKPAARTRRGGLGEQCRPGRAGPGRLRRTEVGAEVAQTGRGEQRVARGVGRDVGVGVALEALRLVGPGQPGEVHGYAVDEPVHVGADADTGESLHAMIMPEQQSRG